MTTGVRSGISEDRQTFRHHPAWTKLALISVIIVFVIVFLQVPPMDPVRQGLVGVVTGLFVPVARGFQAVSLQWESFRSAKDLRERVLRLQMENTVLREQLERTRRELEKQSYLEDLPDLGISRVGRAGLVLWRLPGYPLRRFLIDAGSRAGVRKGAGVISDDRVVGIVGRVWRERSLVYTVLDPGFRAAGKLDSSGAVGLVEGTTNRLVLRYIPSETLVSPGERVLTSGDDDIFPPDLVIGYVRSRQTEGQSYHTLTLEPAFPSIGLRIVVVLPYTAEESALVER